MTIAVDMGRKATNKIKHHLCSGDLVYKFKRIVGKPNFSDICKKDYQSLYKGWIQLGCHATVCMPGFKPNHDARPQTLLRL